MKAPRTGRVAEERGVMEDVVREARKRLTRKFKQQEDPSHIGHSI